ncbi:competence protein F [Candidatus Nitrosoglobus terrae]|uniref:Competence protein F n=1 Tax=Candidatus Nitrosoglobus terrae TaxID=1630141 RepID=A0A1Q2SLH0_9GAMM|nr:ComF family protein [Candidatus Nitrosoglobus terrae]BAW79970.1 competence protein F [Candidatus Nitrosoglobus terrae]
MRLKTLPQRLYPFVCALCGASTDTGLDLCTACQADLPLLGVTCLRCAQPLSAVDPKICGTCQQQAPPQDRTLSAYRYEPPLDHLILQLKFHGKLHLALLLSQLTAQYLIQHSHPLPECIIPVPLHPSRLRERGFNQASEIAKPIATQLKIPINHQIIYRKHNTAPQSGLSQQERKRNIRDAFALHKPLTARHVAIMDDVLTTGHTVAEIAKILRHAGAHTIEVWVCARTLSL